MVSALAFPSIYLLTAHLTPEELRLLQLQIPVLEKDAIDASVILGKISRKERAQFELRRLGITTETVPDGHDNPATATEDSRKRRSSLPSQTFHSASKSKRRRASGEASSPIPISHSDSSSSAAEDNAAPPSPAPQPARAVPAASREHHDQPPLPHTVKVVKLAWFHDSLASQKVLPLHGYVVYTGTVLSFQRTSVSKDALLDPGLSLLPKQQPGYSTPSQNVSSRSGKAQPLSLRSMPEHDDSSDDSDHNHGNLPPLPASLLTNYSCQRKTPLHPPNEEFIDQLKKIRGTRQLAGDRIGVRAYSKAIASLGAYPHLLSSPTEVSRLPGCGPKFAQLFGEFARSGGHIREVDDAEADPKLGVLRLFCKIWGVAEATAHSFYSRGWRDLDDVVDQGWAELTRVQQIGVKYFDELQETLTRAQVEAIAKTVLDHANQIVPGFQMVIAGGYRRGKERSGDVDVILSHPDSSATHHVIRRLLLSLGRAGRVTHTLTVCTANSERDQEPVTWKGNAPRQTLVKSLDSNSAGGTGFDTLDKALVVWQEPMEDLEVREGGADDADDADDADIVEDDKGRKREQRKNTHPHRRVDIIITPWKTAGCAVLGWSGGTMFQRDLRQYCKRERGLKFDSSGARSQMDGSWVDLEDYARDPAPDMLTAERRVFAALGLPWLAPDERCTG